MMKVKRDEEDEEENNERDNANNDDKEKINLIAIFEKFIFTIV